MHVFFSQHLSNLSLAALTLNSLHDTSGLICLRKTDQVSDHCE